MRKILNDKKGFLLGKVTVELLIAIVAILVLAMLGVKLFGIFGKANDERKAEKVLDEIALKAEFLRSSEYTLNEIEVIVHPVEDWFLKSYFIQENAPPDGECIGRFKSCLCNCKEINCLSGLRVCKGINDELIINAKAIYYTSKKGTTYTQPKMIPHEVEGVLQFRDSIAELKIFDGDPLVLTEGGFGEFGTGGGEGFGGSGASGSF